MRRGPFSDYWRCTLPGYCVFNTHKRIFPHFNWPTRQHKWNSMEESKEVGTGAKKCLMNKTNSVLICRSFCNSASRLHGHTVPVWLNPVISSSVLSFYLIPNRSYGQKNKQCTNHNPWPLKGFSQTLKYMLFACIKNTTTLPAASGSFFKNFWQL